MLQPDDPRPLIVHVVFRFDVGGLENGVVNLINHMPADAYRHAIIALTEVTDFRQRIERDDVQFISLRKPPGHLFALYPKLFRLFRELKPAIVHTRNLAALEVTVPAWAAGVPVRIQSEHGRDADDLDGSNLKHKWVRRLYNLFVSRYVALSRDLESWLVERIGIPARKVAQIYNGVDLGRFHPAKGPSAIEACPFRHPDHWLVGTVGRMQTVKDQTLLARAFIRAIELAPELKARLRLVMVGEGPLRAAAQQLLEQAGVADLAWLPGERHDVPDILRGLDCFVLPSLAEGISNTILEAMASGLPVIATRVGGNPELVIEGRTGCLVPSSDVAAMARALVGYATDIEKARAAGKAGREEIKNRFSIEAMVATYHGLYDRLYRVDSIRN
ncbi:MAG: TIGR03088 family PEP-CTERM/XrtA system glycosyltransferase [Gammaproteobacteria bacterium]|nr:TIGR03088 family PEP-CTERM/XrtA system glycosyltransferase [Rhodocyclaceae bacterium]MBU3910132.1 TIGR03088 family PEP-CTERM/XrtA system glycosyltransferase [Gammaproteobacteria bacterium]MBU3990057.1 TIGR03088 family PEP-CTERM/XrtA system glycosyltransferase [Gammaproteobacteria bacterium]MBU4006139.1 TIGR03088 family PEP-CTERM/XrtA system glycosyltransferase [Gammaproteobacteria bacterium]MBU4022594.1 TIGR03088 family PEP-CTERM/XrtA system glycosyltransferase [Gammaproteobacteria bacterium